MLIQSIYYNNNASYCLTRMPLPSYTWIRTQADRKITFLPRISRSHYRHCHKPGKTTLLSALWSSDAGVLADPRAGMQAVDLIVSTNMAASSWEPHILPHGVGQWSAKHHQRRHSRPMNLQIATCNPSDASIIVLGKPNSSS
jgi:hypothetical protein